MAEEPTRQTVWLLDVRLSFPHLFKAKAWQGQENPRFEAQFIIERERQKQLLIELKAALWAVAKAKWLTSLGEEKLKHMLKEGGKKGIEICLHPGEEKEELDGYDDTVMYLSSSSRNAPTVVGPDRSPLTEADGRPYGGCYVNAKITIWAQDNNFGKRINAGLEGVQFKRDGKPFGSRASADEFPDESGGEGKTTEKTTKSDDGDPF